ncbi:MAG: hypothetical protein QGH33_06045, partial [Pirellulaceae bacterium]|nr:hypothetical protein [Pirellulaceae bacterium]
MNTYGCRVWWLGICLCCLHGVVAGESPPVAERQNPVYVEDSPGAEDLIAHAKRLQNNHRMREAVTTFQKVIDEYPFKLMSVESERYTDAALWVTAMIKSDTELLATYRRLHEPMAQRAFALASQPNLDAKALAQVVRRFRLCRGGLESALALAAWRLERADPDSAANTLADVSDHPDLNQLAARWHLLSAACALYQDDPHALARHHRALQSSGDHEALGQLNQWSSSLRRPPQVRSFDAMRSLPTTSVPEAQDDPLWRFDVPTPLPQVSGLAPGQFQSRNGRHTQLWRFVYMLPTAHGDRLYINDGRSVMALDRHAGRPLWSYHSSEPSDRSAARGAVRRMLAVPGHRGLAVHGDRLLAVVDHPTLTRARATQSYHGTSLVCLRGGDGQELWRVSPNDI